MTNTVSQSLTARVLNKQIKFYCQKMRWKKSSWSVGGKLQRVENFGARVGSVRKGVEGAENPLATG